MFSKKELETLLMLSYRVKTRNFTKDDYARASEVHEKLLKLLGRL